MSIEDAWDELDAFMAGGDMSPDGDTDAITLDGQIAANRAGRALARLKRDEDELAAVIAAERYRIDRFEADRRAGIDRARARLAAGLEAFMREEAARLGKTTMKLPTVTLSLRKVIDKIEGTVPEAMQVDDDETRPLWVRRKPATYEIDKTVAKRLLAPGPPESQDDGFDVCPAIDVDGAEVPGVQFRIARDKAFTFELRSESDAEPEEVES